LGRRDRFPATALEHLAEHEIVDRRPARIGLGDRMIVDFARHRHSCPGPPRWPLPILYSARLSASYPAMRLDSRASRTVIASAAGTALSMMPPPSTRAWPSAAS